jgi:hypothetical protein
MEDSSPAAIRLSFLYRSQIMLEKICKDAFSGTSNLGPKKLFKPIKPEDLPFPVEDLKKFTKLKTWWDANVSSAPSPSTTRQCTFCGKKGHLEASCFAKSNKPRPPLASSVETQDTSKTSAQTDKPPGQL